MVNEGLIACIEKYTPEEVSEALIHSFKSNDLNKIRITIANYIKQYGD